MSVRVRVRACVIAHARAYLRPLHGGEAGVRRGRYLTRHVVAPTPRSEASQSSACEAGGEGGLQEEMRMQRQILRRVRELQGS